MRKQKKGHVMYESRSPLLTRLPQRIKYQGRWWYLCLGHCCYHKATEVNEECPNLTCVYKLPMWIKQELSMKRPDAPTKTSGPTIKVDDKLLVKTPTVLEYLTDTKWEDGADRELATLSIFVEDGHVKLALNDKDQRRSLYVAAESIERGLQALERALNAATADWRVWNTKTKKK